VSVSTPTAPRTSTRPEQRRSHRRQAWGTPAALLLLSVIPVVAGALRLVEVAGGPHLLPANPRLGASPIPLVVHVLASAAYACAGAFQFPRRLRRRHPTWHRRAGRVLAVAAMLVAASALWMTLFSTGAPGGHLLRAVRILVAVTMGAAVVLGVTAVRRRNLPAHRAWMIRAYALALGAGTQTVTQGVGQACFGPGDLSTAWSLTAGWLINAAVAEWVIHRGLTA
jgi:uncharacterized membrane protein